MNKAFKDKVSQLKRENRELKKDSRRLDHIAAHWDSQCVSKQTLLGGRAISNPTGSFRAAIDKDMK